MNKSTTLQVAIGFVIALAIGLTACVVDRSESRKHDALRREQVRSALSSAGARLEAELNERLQLAYALEALVLLRPSITQAEFTGMATGLDHQVAGIRALQLARRGVVTHVHPEAPNRVALGHALLEDPRTAPAAEAALAWRQLRVAGPYALRQGSEGLVARLPIFRSSGHGMEFWGFAIVVMDFHELLRSAGLSDPAGIDIAMRGRDGRGAQGEVFRGAAAIFDAQAVTADVTFPNGHWQLAGRPSEGWGAPWPGRPWLALAAALLIASVPPGIWLFRRHSEARSAVERLRLRERMLVSLGDGVFGVDRMGRCTFVNPAALAMLGVSREEVVGRDARALFHDESELARVTRERRGEAMMRRRDGSPLPARVTYEDLEDGEGGVIAFHDVAAQRAAADRLRLAASVFAHTQQGIMITDAEGTLVDVNPAFTRITGYSREEVLGKNPRVLSSGRQTPEFYAKLKHSLATEGTWRGEIWNRHKSGQVYPELLHIAAVPGPGGRPEHFIGVFSDISRQKEHEAELTRVAHYDPLTALPNRLLLTDRLSQAVAAARAQGGRLALGILDIDGFKDVNDRFGHDVGDRVLVEVANRLREVVRPSDTVARFGGDEFAVLIGPIGGVEACEAHAHRLIESLAAPMEIDGRRIRLPASVGFTLFPDDRSNAEALVRHAAQAMFVAKQEGGGRYRLFDPEQDRQARVRREALDRFAHAIERDELRLVYQPQVDMREGRVIGFEALVRWQHPQRGLLEPDAFLPLIAGTDLDVALGRWVVRHAIAQLAAWRGRGLTFGVSMNVSAPHLLAPRFLAELDAALAQHPAVNARGLEIEVLESLPFENIGAATRVLRECLERGVGVAIDDFGTGYSSLAYFKHLPARTLKIDRIFVRDLPANAEDRAIVEGIIRFARAFGLEIVAEGVEDDAIAAVLLSMGCTVGQGYGISRPMWPDDVPGWVHDYRAAHARPRPMAVSG